MRAAQVEHHDPADDQRDPRDLLNGHPSPRNSIPIAAIAAVPSPAQIAYAVPTDMVFSVCASSAKATRNPERQHAKATAD